MLLYYVYTHTSSLFFYYLEVCGFDQTNCLHDNVEFLPLSNHPFIG